MTATNRKTSILIACGIALAVAVWMLSGLGRTPVAVPERSALAAGDASDAPVRVLVQDIAARQVTREVVVSGRTKPNRAIELKAETDGAVVLLGAERGSRVDQGQRIVGLDIRDRNEQLREAEALVVQRRLESEAANRLRGQQFVSEAQIAEAQARLVSAEAARERIELDIRHTSVTAPFDAVVQDRVVEIGDYVKSGDTVAYLVDIDPIVVVGEVNERDIGHLEVGSEGTARLVGGEIVEGTIRYLAPVAADSTRTYSVELAVPNPAGAIRAGLTAELRLAADVITAHALTPALLALADDGTVGVKAVDEFNRVRFYPVEIIGSSDAGVSVTGLPEQLRIITVGQGFVTEGQTVEAVLDSAALSVSENERAY
jgi:membrane fusion protein, multidrug efflux system